MRDDFLNFNEYIEPDMQRNKKDSIIISGMIEYPCLLFEGEGGREEHDRWKSLERHSIRMDVTERDQKWSGGGGVPRGYYLIDRPAASPGSGYVYKSPRQPEHR